MKRRSGLCKACWLPALGMLLAVFAAVPGWAQDGGADDIFSEYDVQVGKTIRKDDCARIEHAVWVEHRHGSECIRYFPSPDAVGARQAVIYIHGDRRSGRTVISSAYRDNSRNAQMALAARNARNNRVPFIMLARPGAYGSSGDHGARRQPKEFYSLDAAVDAIKTRLGIDKLILAGQSGGATAVAALLTLGRSDVSCVVATSGNYDVLALAEIKRAKLGLAPKRGMDVTGYAYPYNVIDFVAGIVADAQRRILVIGDPLDANTVYPLQKAFADRLAQAGHAVELIEARGVGPDRHSLSHIGYKAAGWCAAGLPAELIRKKVQSNAAALGVVPRESSGKGAAAAPLISQAVDSTPE